VLGVGGKGRHAALVRERDVPAPFDLGEFVLGLERQRHRPILLCPFSLGPGIPCGLWIGTADVNYIYHGEGTTPYHQTHIALHEPAHMLLDNRGAAQVWERLVNLLVPDVDPQLVQLVLGRSMYTAEEERDADHLRDSARHCVGGCGLSSPVGRVSGFSPKIARSWARSMPASRMRASSSTYSWSSAAWGLPPPARWPS